jgi:hypothetical protein
VLHGQLILATLGPRTIRSLTDNRKPLAWLLSPYSAADPREKQNLIVYPCRDYDRASSLRMLVQGCFGSLLGALLAMALAHPLVPPQCVQTSIANGYIGLVCFDPAEKSFYLLSLLLGPAGAFFATRRLFPGAVGHLVLLGVLAAAVPLGNAYAGAMLQGNMPAWVGIVLVGVLASTFFYSMIYLGIEPKFQQSFTVEDRNRSLWVFFCLLSVLTLIIVPRSFQAVAARIGIEYSIASFFFAPSLYFLGQGLLPGVDYYTQYGLGLGWAFSFFLGRTVELTMVHYVILMVVALWLFFAHLIWMLRWLYRSWFASAAISLLVLILLFHTDRPYVDPSSFVVRYPLLTVSGACLVRWVAAPRGWIAFLSLAMTVAASLFMETETGIIISISVALAFLLTAPRPLASVVPLAGLGVTCLVFFVLLLLFVFGPGVLSREFLSGLVEPLMLFGVNGLGAWPIAWTLGEWNWLYNFVAPGVALATLGILARAGRSENTDRPRLALLAFFAGCGLLMMAKFINMSIVGVWQMNALGFLVVLGWWAVAVARHLPRRLDLRGFAAIPVRSVTSILMLVPAVALATTSSDHRNPELYGAQSWLKYPALLLAPFQSSRDCINMECVADRPDPRDVALIRERTRPGEPVAIVGDLYDWAYLIDAHRPPMLAFLPSSRVFTQRQLDQSWKHMMAADYWFVPRDKNGEPAIEGPLSSLAMPVLQHDFVIDGIGDRLVAWKRKSP